MPASPSVQPPNRPRFLSEADCQDLLHRLTRFARGGGECAIDVVSIWTGNTRWARNLVSTAGDDRDNRIVVHRVLQGADGFVLLNATSDRALMAATRQAERRANLRVQKAEFDLPTRPDSPFRVAAEPYTAPALFWSATYDLDGGRRAAVARQMAQSAAAAGMLSAGYLEVSAVSQASLTSWGTARYFQYTWAQCSVTVRDPNGVGSGWAGIDWPDWSKIDGQQLAAVALDKCLKSRNPVAIEPGRYTTILEPQAVNDFIGLLVRGRLDRQSAETNQVDPFHRSGSQEPPNIDIRHLGVSHLGERVIDARLTISADPLDPELGFPPFPKSTENSGDDPTVYHPATWIENGILKNLPYRRTYAASLLGRTTGLPNAGAFRMRVNGPTTTVAEMIATMKRGVLVTRFDRVDGPTPGAMLCRGYTRDGLWLIENGKISKPIRNMVFVESIMFALNNVEQIGLPQRVFNPGPSYPDARFEVNPRPAIVPPLKIRDFSFTALTAAI